MIKLLVLVSFLTISLQKVLVLIDNQYLIYSHQTFFADLKVNHEVQIQNVVNDKIILQQHNDYFYDNIILMCSSFNISNELALQLKEFFDSGKNIIIAADIDTSNNFRKLLLSFGIQIDKQGNQLYDHTRNIENASIIMADNFSRNEQFIEKNQKPILYRGIGLQLTIYENYQQYTLTNPSPNCISISTDGQITNIGNNIALVVGIQGRTNGRVVATGSLDMFSNELYELSNFENRKFAQNLLKWGFNEKGKLRVKRIFHAKQGEQASPFSYRIKDDFRFEIDIEVLENNQWINFETDDLQLEFQMIDPYIRTLLKNKENSPTFYTDLKIPDQYGVFKFQVSYKKPGFTFLDESVVIPVRPLKHNEYDRYLFQATPYYFGLWSTFAGFLIFIFYFMFHEQKINNEKQ